MAERSKARVALCGTKRDIGGCGLDDTVVTGLALTASGDGVVNESEVAGDTCGRGSKDVDSGVGWAELNAAISNRVISVGVLSNHKNRLEPELISGVSRSIDNQGNNWGG